MYCRNCGVKLEDQELYCPKCGAKTSDDFRIADAPSFGCALLSFFIPLAGIILWLVWKDEYPLKAKSCSKGAVLGFILGFIFTFILNILILFI